MDVLLLLGGLAFFLFGMNVMSDGLRKVAGGSLEHSLKKITGNRWMAMLLGRFVPIVLVLGLAGSLAQRTRVPVSVGTLPTHGPLFVTLLVGVVLIVALLTFVPVLALSPIAEALS